MQSGNMVHYSRNQSAAGLGMDLGQGVDFLSAFLFGDVPYSGGPYVGARLYNTSDRLHN